MLYKLFQLTKSSQKKLLAYRYHFAKDIYSDNGFELTFEVNQAQRLYVANGTFQDVLPLEAAADMFDHDLIKELLNAGATEKSSAEIQKSFQKFFKQCGSAAYEDKNKIIKRKALIEFLINECGLIKTNEIEDTLHQLDLALTNVINTLSADGYKKLVSYEPNYSRGLRFTSIKDLNKYGYTPLHIAAKFGDVTLIQEIIAKGADINLIDSKGHTSLYYATIYGRLKAVQCLKSITDLSKNKNDLEEAYDLAKSYQQCSFSLCFWKTYQNIFVSSVDYKGVVNSLKL